MKFEWLFLLFFTDKMDNLDDMFGSDEDAGVGSESASNRPESCGVLKFHNGTEDSLYHYVTNKAIRGDLNGILKTIDDFCYTQHWMMHIGDQKLRYLKDAITMARNQESSKLCVVELGSYCGYSAIYLASLLDKEKSDRLYCVEGDPKCVGYTRRMLSYANLDEMVTVIGSAASECSTWRSQLNKDHVDVLFIDHDKAQYLNDLIRVEKAGLLQSGSVVVADNILSFGVPLSEYLEHVRDEELYRSSQLFEGFIEYASGEGEELNPVKDAQLVDGVEISVYK